MTVSKDKASLGRNIAKETTDGVPLDGFQDPTGEYPKREYHYDNSINKAARGTKINELYVGGGDIGVPLNIEDQQPSQYPFNQVKETASGHVVEYDDTPGGERVLIKHRSGAGVEMRADGSLVISAVNNKIEVTGGDQTVIIEGNGNMVYKGTLNLTVAGDYNVDVAGNYNINVAGSKNESISQNNTLEIGKNNKQLVKGSRTENTLGPRVMQNLDSLDITSKTTTKIKTAENMEFISGGQLLQSASTEWVSVSKTASISSINMSILGVKGSIGGDAMDFTGKIYQGPAGPVPFTSGAAFFGSFYGQATEAQLSGHSLTADWAKYAVGASKATSKSAVTPGVPVKLPPKQQALAPNGPPPNAPIVTGHLTLGSYAVRTIKVDDDNKYRDSLILADDYAGIFEKVPTTQELRSAFRDKANKSKLHMKMVAEGRISHKSYEQQPSKTGRVSNRNPSSKFGYTPLGNGIANRGKRFTP